MILITRSYPFHTYDINHTLLPISHLQYENHIIVIPS